MVARETTLVTLNNREYKFPFFGTFYIKYFIGDSTILFANQNRYSDLIEEFGVPQQKTS